MSDTRSHEQKMDEMRRRFEGARATGRSLDRSHEKSQERTVAREQDPLKPSRNEGPSRAPRLRR